MNEPLTFINFVAAFPVGSTIQGEVVSFTSHGAMVDVPLPGGGELHCYIPLTAMGTPPPTKARQVLKKGEVRSFVLAGLDPPRRVAELAIPPAAAGRAEADLRQEGCTGRQEGTHHEGGSVDEEGRGEEGGCAGEESDKEGRGGRCGQEGAQEGCGEEGGQAQEGARQEVTGEESRQDAGTMRAVPLP